MHGLPSILIILLSLFITSFRARAGEFLFGIKGGINFSMVAPTQRFSVRQPVNGNFESDTEKDYASFFKNTGYQYGFIGMYRFSPSLTLSLEPTFSNYTIKYSTESRWFDSSDPNDRIEISTAFTDKLRYFEMPLVLRFEFGNGNIRPFLAAGISYGMLTGASGAAESTTVQHINDIATTLEESNQAGDISANYISTRLVTFPGAGLFADFGFATFFAEADYFIGLHNIVNESARYDNQQSIGNTYNVPDNLQFNNLVFNLGILFNINRKESSGAQGRSKGSAVPCPTPKRKK